MDYALLPFAIYPYFNKKVDGLADIRHALSQRQPTDSEGPGSLELLDHVVECLRELPWTFYVDRCREEAGNLHLSVLATDLNRELDLEDELKAGFYLWHSETGEFETQAGTRIFRVACANGFIMECEEEQSVKFATDRRPAQWQFMLREVIHRSFSADGADVDAARFRVTMHQMLSSPYEYLCHLNARGVITEDEQCDITQAFHEEGDLTMYGLINAVTQMAHRLREDNSWTRALHFERLGGRIIRGDFHVYSFDPVPV